MIRFSDGINVDMSGPLRSLRLSDGLYVVGNGMMIPVEDRQEAQDIITEGKEISHSKLFN